MFVDQLDRARARRWWQVDPSIESLHQAAAFIEDVDFALLFPKRGIELPSLWEATSDRPLHNLAKAWGPDLERVWGWKDELPRQGLAWYGRFLHGQPSFLSPALLALLYPRPPAPDDFRDCDPPLSPEGTRVAEFLLRNGPMPTAVLRQACGFEGKRGGAQFSKLVGELGRALVVTTFGTEQEGAGWPSAVLELTVRAFPLAAGPGLARGRLDAACRFLNTMLTAHVEELAAAFGWLPAHASSALETLEREGAAVRDGAAFHATASRSRVCRRRSVGPSR